MLCEGDLAALTFDLKFLLDGLSLCDGDFNELLCALLVLAVPELGTGRLPRGGVTISTTGRMPLVGEETFPDAGGVTYSRSYHKKVQRESIYLHAVLRLLRQPRLLQ